MDITLVHSVRINYSGTNVGRIILTDVDVMPRTGARWMVHHLTGCS